ncbi:hypothetical protein [Flavobacterium sp. RSP15]|uniref:hypothetical protein n=1 Tax=Flavobacterium sp. RSP15 TaxID=2497485 RepID=UPI000F83BACC|nr:hypothetical protein [Flavobacterium sp. RSP15]RTY87432.1 hypothetical protein EKM00_06935 [Flavobacterium sp. RSP15]
MSVALYFFSGCSFAQPSGLAPFREKRHVALNQGTPAAVFYFFPAVSRSSPFILRLVPRQLQFSASGGCSIAATPPLRSSINNDFHYRYNHHFLRCLGVFDCLARETKQSQQRPQKNLNKTIVQFLEKKKKKIQ